MIQLIDARTNTQIWQGYTLTHYQAIDYGNGTHVRNAVTSILSQYTVWADGLMRDGALTPIKVRCCANNKRERGHQVIGE
jgi:hypothetical protein